MQSSLGDHDVDVPAGQMIQPPGKASGKQLKPALEEIGQLVGDRLTTSEAVRRQHGEDHTWHERADPDAVVFVDTADEVAQIVAICARHGVPIIPFGAGSSLEGHLRAPYGGITLDFNAMDRILRVSREDMDCTVEPGVKRKQLNEHLRDTGLFFAIDPGADASIGGMAATRASGTNALRYGTMRENVISLKTVMTDGSVITSARRARKSAAGYDLTRLLVGSEGTLGIFTEITLKLHGIPEAISGGVCAFKTLKGACDTAIETIQMGIPAARIELLDELHIKAVNDYSKLDLEVAPTLFVEFHGTDASVAEQAEQFGEIARENGGLDFNWSGDMVERKRLWHARDNTFWAAMALRPGCRGFVTDVCVPISRLAECVGETQKDIQKSGLTGPIVGHVGDGNFHVNLIVDPGDGKEVGRAKAFSKRLVERALAMEGTSTGEHGVGLGKREYLVAEHGQAVQFMRTIKQALDPRNILNPGKIFSNGGEEQARMDDRAPAHGTSADKRGKALDELTKLLGKRLSTSRDVRAQHGDDLAWIEGAPPDAVAYVETTAQVRDIVRICAAHDMPIIPYGAGTSLEGHIHAPFGGVTLDFSAMNAVLAVHEDDMDCVVEAGTTRKTLNRYLRDRGLFFPIDPGADASIGGMAATRASGTNAVRYGTMRENVLSMKAVMADGSIITTSRRARKSAAGYDLTRLLVGSEGTLGIITEVTLKLHGIPEAIAGGVCSFDSLRGACAAAIETIQMGIPIARIELLDDVQVKAINGYSKLDLAETPTLFVEFHGTDASVAEQAERFGQIVRDHRGGDFEWSSQADKRAKLWQARYDAYLACLAYAPGRRGFVTDVCVPISRLAECVEETQRDIAETGLIAPIVGHVGDGNFHVSLMIDPAQAKEIEQAKAFSKRLVERALDMGGTCTGEHGVGMGKMEYLEAEHGGGVDVMRAIKRALDPQNILNPGKMIAL